MYIFQGFFTNPLFLMYPTIAHIYNALIKALNNIEHLPQYVLLLPDKDITTDVAKLKFSCGGADSLEANINWLLKHIAKVLLTRHDDL